MPVEPNGYYDRANPDLLAAIPPDAKKVIEIGCGTGALAAAYRRINPGVKWYGVEPDSDAREKASEEGRCTTTVSPGMTSRDSVFLRPFTYDDATGDEVDCLVFGDVLEHMDDPWGDLKHYVEYLRDGGVVVASIPNVQHFSLIAALLAGKWEYADEGLLDRTHRWFFGVDQIKAMFRDAGLTPWDIRSRRIDEEGHAEFCEAARPLVEHLGVSFGDFVKRSRAFQYVVKAVKGPDPEPMVVRAVVGCEVCANVRVHEPGRHLATIPGVRYEWIPFDKFDDVPWESPVEKKLVILQRAVASTEQIDRLKALGWKIVFEIDDDIDYFEDVRADDYRILRECDAVQVSTINLMRRVCQIGEPAVKKILYTQNHISDLPPKRDRDNPDVIRVFFGAINRESDWKPIVEAVNHVIELRREKAEFVVVNDPGFFEALQTDRKTLFPYLPYADYRDLLGTCDIALMPLEPTPFNSFKSDLKAIEAAAESVVPLMPMVKAYEEFYGAVHFELMKRENLRDREWYSTPVYRDAEMFAETLLDLIGQSDRRQMLIDIGHKVVEQSRLLSLSNRSRHEQYLNLFKPEPVRA